MIVLVPHQYIHTANYGYVGTLGRAKFKPSLLFKAKSNCINLPYISIKKNSLVVNFFYLFLFCRLNAIIDRSMTKSCNKKLLL